MKLRNLVVLLAGGRGSGCNPDKGKCGRHPGEHTWAPPILKGAAKIKGNMPKTHVAAVKRALAKFPANFTRGVTIQWETKEGHAGANRAMMFGPRTTMYINGHDFSENISYTSGDMNGESVGSPKIAKKFDTQVPEHVKHLVDNVGAHTLEQTVAHELGHHIDQKWIRNNPELEAQYRKVFSGTKAVDTKTVHTYANYYNTDATEMYGRRLPLFDNRLVQERFAEAVRLKVSEPRLYKKQVSAPARKFVDMLFKRFGK